ncbi:Wzz/FepE/Etk N-terminal domain-containing protein [Flavobacteriaceae bacterium]|nr:Wzz/FepE/Etk N-terminal domain-containing protein [Flavobacteriaceae bacterium]
MNSSQQTHLEAEDQIDIIALFSKVWAGRKFVVKSAAIAGVFGVLIAILTPNTFTASSMFTPNSSGSSSGGSSGLKGLASLAGINIGSSMEGAKEISPMLYGKILESYTFKKELLEAPLKNLGEVTSLRDFFEQESSSSSFFGTVKEYTIGLPSKIIGLFKSERIETSLQSVEGMNTVSEEEFEYFKGIDEMLTLNINYKDGYLEISATSKLPQLAAQLVKNGENILQNQIIAIKTKSSLELLAYLEEQYTIKNKLLVDAQDNLANFKDRNLNISRSSFSNAQTRLEAELQVATSVFQNVVTQLEQVKLQVAKDTPVFSFLKPVIVPTEKSAPKRSLIVIIWLFLGVVVSIGYLLAKEPLLDMIKQIKNNPS